MTNTTKRPRVAMIVANDVTIDGRVKKTAATVSELGYEVVLLGLSKRNREEGWLGDCHLIRVANQKIFLGDVMKPKPRRDPRSWLAFSTRDEYVTARHRVKLRERELETAPLLEHADGVRGWIAPVERKARRLVLAAMRRVTDWRYGYGRSLPSPKLRAPSGRERLRAQIDDWEFTFGVELDRLAPDVIHVHDVHLLGVAARAKARAARQGRSVVLIYDAHEYVQGQTHVDQELLDVYIDVERRYIKQADWVTTVSPAISAWLARDYGLPTDRISVVLNAPQLSWQETHNDDSLSVKEAAGLSPETPLVIYSGGQSDARGVPDLVDAMEFLPGVHCALVASPTNRYVYQQQRRAEEAGWGDRVHIAPFVPPERVPSYLSKADIGVMPLRHTLNHDAALPNKLFEYLHAGLPVVTSDVPLAAELVTERGFGTVFTAERPEELAAAIRRVLDDIETYRAAVTPDVAREFSWESQALLLGDVYRAVAPPAPARSPDRTVIDEPQGAGAVDGHEVAAPEQHSVFDHDHAARHLLIGPANMAGQAHAWAHALRTRSNVRATSLTLERSNAMKFPTDESVSKHSWGSRPWQVQQLFEIPGKYTHVLLESGLGILGTLNGGTFLGDTPFLLANGVKVAAVFHGSDIRNPRAHAEREPFSPFTDPIDDLTSRLQVRVDRAHQELERFPGPVFVTTLDLVDDVVDAIWLPTTLDLDLWQPAAAPDFDRVPTVLHAPTNAQLKGTQFIDPLLKQLQAEGLIRYDRIANVPHDQMSARVAAADIVIDQLVLGHYGLFAMEALATGRVVIANVSERVRRRFPIDVPVVQADPSDLEEVLRSMVADPTEALAAAERGREFVRAFHDGTLASQQLLTWMSGGTIEPVPVQDDESLTDALPSPAATQ